MNRRKVIARLFLTAVGGGIVFSNYKWHQLYKSPDIGYLEKNRSLIAHLANTIIPATDDSPGAKETSIESYIIIMLKDCSDIKTRNKFIDGLKHVEQYTKNRYHQSFENCAKSEKEEILKYFEKKGKPLSGILGKAEEKLLGKSFFSILKELTVKGFCTSELGATKGLNYISIPGAFQGCIQIAKGQRAWTTK